jgi:hypothetical protein
MEDRTARRERMWALYEGKSYWYYFRNIRTTQERRAAANPEHFPYIRRSRSLRGLPSAYDDIPACREKNWKARCKKARRQWETHAPEHIDTCRAAQPES